MKMITFPQSNYAGFCNNNSNEGDGVRLILHGYSSGDLFQIRRRKDTPRGKRYSFILFSVARFIFPFVQCVYHIRIVGK